MKPLFPIMLAAVALTTAATLPAKAGDIQGDAYDCGELWNMRNQIFKDNGYCFKSAKAIKKFGNAGCQYDDESEVPLSKQDRAILKDIKKSERRQSC